MPSATAAVIDDELLKALSILPDLIIEKFMAVNQKHRDTIREFSNSVPTSAWEALCIVSRSGVSYEDVIVQMENGKYRPGPEFPQRLARLEYRPDNTVHHATPPAPPPANPSLAGESAGALTPSSLPASPRANAANNNSVIAQRQHRASSTLPKNLWCSNPDCTMKARNHKGPWKDKVKACKTHPDNLRIWYHTPEGEAALDELAKKMKENPSLERAPIYWDHIMLANNHVARTQMHHSMPQVAQPPNLSQQAASDWHYRFTNYPANNDHTAGISLDLNAAASDNLTRAVFNASGQTHPGDIPTAGIEPNNANVMPRGPMHPQPPNQPRLFPYSPQQAYGGGSLP